MLVDIVLAVHAVHAIVQHEHHAHVHQSQTRHNRGAAPVTFNCKLFNALHPAVKRAPIERYTVFVQEAGGSGTVHIDTFYSAIGFQE
jgi:poly-gamma-glutamate capsule biosynthesis protein CapA/YwtB (metallophosphatase superfamily)